MSDGLNQSFGHYPKRKGKKGVRFKDNAFLKKTFHWLRWKVEKIGEVRIHHPCLEH